MTTLAQDIFRKSWVSVVLHKQSTDCFLIIHWLIIVHNNFVTNSRLRNGLHDPAGFLWPVKSVCFLFLISRTIQIPASKWHRRTCDWLEERTMARSMHTFVVSPNVKTMWHQSLWTTFLYRSRQFLMHQLWLAPHCYFAQFPDPFQLPLQVLVVLSFLFLFVFHLNVKTDKQHQ